jgi:hypothetical protein
MEAFQNTLEECRLSDLGYRSPKFTWSNCREGDDFTKERFDRVVANCGRCQFFVEVSVGAAVWSDHAQIYLTLQNTSN